MFISLYDDIIVGVLYSRAFKVPLDTLEVISETILQVLKPNQ